MIDWSHYQAMDIAKPLIWFCLIVLALAFAIGFTTTRRIRKAVLEHETALLFAAQLGSDAGYFCRLFTGGHHQKLAEKFPDFEAFARDRRTSLEQEYAR